MLRVVVTDTRSMDAIYVAAITPDVRVGIEQRRQAALAVEDANPTDPQALEALLK